MPQSQLAFGGSHDEERALDIAMNGIQEASAKLPQVQKGLMAKDAQLSIRDATIAHLKHKVTRLEEQAKLLKQQINVELSHHARYNAVKDEAQKSLDAETCEALLRQARERAKKILVKKTKEQEEKYAEAEGKEGAIDEAFEKKIDAMRKKHTARVAALEEGGHANGGGGKHKAVANGGKPATAKGDPNDGPKRKAIPVPRARFIKDMTPLYNKEKEAAVAKAKAEGHADFTFPKLFVWITEPWKNLDPEVKKRKYQDPFEEDKKKREREDADAKGGASSSKKARPANKGAKAAAAAAAKTKKKATPDADGSEQDEAEGPNDSADGSGSDNGDGSGSDDGDEGDASGADSDGGDDDDDAVPDADKGNDSD